MTYDRELAAHKLRRWENFLQQHTLPDWEQLPFIDLYMDQVLALLGQYLRLLSADGAGAPVTAAAINNYVRTKVMPPPHKKKYGRVHLAYLLMICTLKQGANVALMHKLLPAEAGEQEVRAVYTAYVQQHQRASRYFAARVRESAAAGLLDDPPAAPVNTDAAVTELIASCAIVAGLARLLTEKLVCLEGLTLADIAEAEYPQLPR